LSILVTNFAGFSVVVVSLFFFLLPAFINIPDEIEIKPNTKFKIKQYILLPIIIIFAFIFLKNTISFYLADVMYAKSSSYEDKNDYQNALSLIQLSLDLNPEEPIYLDKLSDISAKLAISTNNQQYIDQSISASDKAVNISPANISFWKQRAQNYLYFSTIDSTYYQESINSLLKASKLAPTDAKIFYTIGQFLETASLTDQSIPYYQQAITLKSNYDYAYFALGQIYLTKKDFAKAKENLQKTVDYSYPTNTEAEKLLKTINY
jgi:tetratricopeptide (TPR) repeat protein